MHTGRQVPRRRLCRRLLALPALALAACSPQLPVVHVEPPAPSLHAAASGRPGSAIGASGQSGSAEAASLAPSVAARSASAAPSPAPQRLLPLPSPAPASPVPAAVTPTPVVPQPTPTLAALDSTKRAELFDRVWSAVDSHYIDADKGGVDWKAIKAEYRPQALAAASMPIFYDTLTRMVSELGDRHSRFEDPQRAFAQRALASGEDAYVGVGVLTVPVEDGLLVTTVFENSPAAEAGIARRDVVVAVDGRPVSHADTRLGGEQGSPVTLTVRSPDGAERAVTLRCRAVVAHYLPEAYLLPDTRVGYVLIQSFWPQNTAADTTAALERLLDQHGELDGLIVDVRGNGGGWRTVLEGVLGNFVAGEVGTFFGQNNSYALSVAAGPLRRRLDGVPLVVLVDGETESYAEVFAAVLQAEGRAEIVGAPSAGNTETIFAYDFEDGSRLWIAQEGFRLSNGDDLEGRGVAPDRALEVDWTRFSERRDPHIVAALEMLATTAGAK